jgi:hypothetical protein
MFDGGNFLSTDLEEDFEYTASRISPTDAFGTNSRYYT